MAISRVSGLVLDPDSTDFLVRALEMLTELLRARGAEPTAKLAAMTDELRTGAIAGAKRPKSGVSARFVDGESVSEHTPWHAILDSRRAADILGITPNGVRDLARRGSLPAHRAGREWMFDAAAVIRRAESASR